MPYSPVAGHRVCQSVPWWVAGVILVESRAMVGRWLAMPNHTSQRMYRPGLVWADSQTVTQCRWWAHCWVDWQCYAHELYSTDLLWPYLHECCSIVWLAPHCLLTLCLCACRMCDDCVTQDWHDMLALLSIVDHAMKHRYCHTHFLREMCNQEVLFTLLICVFVRLNEQIAFPNFTLDIMDGWIRK